MHEKDNIAIFYFLDHLSNNVSCNLKQNKTTNINFLNIKLFPNSTMASLKYSIQVKDKKLSKVTPASFELMLEELQPKVRSDRFDMKQGN